MNVFRPPNTGDTGGDGALPHQCPSRAVSKLPLLPNVFMLTCAILMIHYVPTNKGTFRSAASLPYTLGWKSLQMIGSRKQTPWRPRTTIPFCRKLMPGLFSAKRKAAEHPRNAKGCCRRGQPLRPLLRRHRCNPALQPCRQHLRQVPDHHLGHHLLEGRRHHAGPVHRARAAWCQRRRRLYQAGRRAAALAEGVVGAGGKRQAPCRPQSSIYFAESKRWE